MRSDEQKDGSGDLVFEERRTWVGYTNPIGFLGIEGIQDVESLVRETLAPGRRSWDPDGDDAVRPAPRSRPIGALRSYRLSGPGLAFLTSIGLVFGLIVLIGLAWIILLPLAWIWGIVPVPAARGLLKGGGTGLMFLIPLFFATRMVITMPITITIDEEERNVWFVNWFRRRCVPAAAFLSIRTGGWRDPNSAYVEIRHQGGKLTIFNQYPGFPGFPRAPQGLEPVRRTSGVFDGLVGRLDLAHGSGLRYPSA